MTRDSVLGGLDDDALIERYSSLWAETEAGPHDASAALLHREIYVRFGGALLHAVAAE